MTSYPPAGTSRHSSQLLSSARSSVSSTLGLSNNDTLSLRTNGSSFSSASTTYISVDLDNKEAIIYPNKIIRGTVKVVASKVIYASQIRIKFRGVECAIVKVNDTHNFPKLHRIETITTTYFEVETNVWGTEPNGPSINNWKTIEPGEHKFKFALKFPKVNFPPSTESLTGFSIRYIWTAFLDGPFNHPSIRSKDLLTPYRPLLCCPSPTPWTFTETVFSVKKAAALASIAVSLPTQVFVAQQRFSLDLTIKFKTASTIAASISCKLRQYYQGQVQLPHYGTVRRHFHRDIMYRSISIPPSAATANNRIHLSEVSVTMPSNWVLPCFTSNHMRMYYTLVIVVSSREPGFFGAVNQGEVEIPIGMANLEENQWGRVYDIQDRQQSTDAPFFFDPSLSEPANEQEADLIQVDTTGASNHGTDDDTEEEGNNSRLSPPPSYASLQQQYRQRQARRSKKRVEKTRYSSHWVKPGMMPELGEALTVILEDLNEEHQATSGI